MKLRSSKEVSWVSKPGLFNLGFTMRQIFQYQNSSYLEEFSELGGEMGISKTETYAPGRLQVVSERFAHFSPPKSSI